MRGWKIGREEVAEDRRLCVSGDRRGNDGRQLAVERGVQKKLHFANAHNLSQLFPMHMSSYPRLSYMEKNLTTCLFTMRKISLIDVHMVAGEVG